LLPRSIEAESALPEFNRVVLPTLPKHSEGTTDRLGEPFGLDVFSSLDVVLAI
jgi:hypothetical protein